MEKQRVYIETSIISYLTARPSRDLVIAGNQQITADWWKNARPKFDCYISQFVRNEIMKGDKIAAAKRLEVTNEFQLLEYFEDIDKLANYYFKVLNIPEKARFDSYHLAMACIHNIDYLLSWNCKHIANAKINGIIRDYNNKIGINTPYLCTPYELLEV